MSNLIVIEGLDGCGKTTQINLLKKALPASRIVSFPDYIAPTGQLIKSFLAGDIQANRYAASCMYAIDRYNSYMSDWQHQYLENTPIICGRYTTSNMIYQGASLIDRPGELNTYLAWLNDLEYTKLQLPHPNKVIYLDMPLTVSNQLLTERYKGDESKKDIFERNESFRLACEKTAKYLAAKYNWSVIPCTIQNNLRSIQDIHADIMKEIATI